MGALIIHLPSHRHIYSHPASLCWLSFFLLITENKVSPLLLPPPPHFPCRTNEAVDSTPYWHSAKSPSLPQTASAPLFLFPLLISTRLPSRLVPSFYGSSLHSEMTRMKCSIINCWYADPPSEGSTSHGWGRRGGGGENTTPKKSEIGDSYAPRQLDWTGSRILEAIVKR